MSGGFSFAQSLLGTRPRGRARSSPSATTSTINASERRQRHAQAARAVRQHARAVQPEADGAEQSDRAAQGRDNIVYFEVQAQTSQARPAASLTTIQHDRQDGRCRGGDGRDAADQRGRPRVADRAADDYALLPQPFVNDPNPQLRHGRRCVNPVPQVQAREMESVLQVGQRPDRRSRRPDAGRRAARNRDQMPVVGNVPQPGRRFSASATRRASKTELVIFLRPTVIANPSLESDELRFFQRFLPQPETPPDLSQVPPISGRPTVNNRR